MRDALCLSAHHPVEVPRAGNAVQFVLAAALHGRIFAMALPAGKLDVESFHSNRDVQRGFVGRLPVPGRVARFTPFGTRRRGA